MQNRQASQLYAERVEKFHLQVDPIQAMMMKNFDTLQHSLQSTEEKPSASFFNFWKKPSGWQFQKGYYLWGGVGRGKTMMMDIFFDTLTTQYKQRLHFHRFMQTIHQELRQLSNTINPLGIVAQNFAKHYRVLCLDEFHVNDIADAMILGGLLEALFAQGVTLITTSNRPPDDLYKNGLQRERFIPAIENLKKFTQVINIDNQTDYRLLTLQTNPTYNTPLNADTEVKLKNLFDAMTTGNIDRRKRLDIANHELSIVGQGEGVIWFEFAELCETNRSQNDYLEIALEHHSVFLSNVPILDDDSKDAARRFLNLLDVLYDHRVKLILSAEAEPHKLYQGKFLAFEFDRAVSRLIEMQSDSYLAQRRIDTVN